MRTVYAIQFEVAPREEEGGSDTLGRVCDCVREWVGSRYGRNWNLDVELEFDGVASHPSPGHRLSANLLEAAEDHALATVEWLHPGTDDESLLWTTSCTLAKVADRLEVSATVRISLRGGEIRPIPQYDVGRPGFIAHLLENESCRIGGEELPHGVQEVKVGEVEDFVTQLTDPARRLPIVLLSVDAWTENPFTDPELLADRLLGLARVVVIEKHATFGLTDKVGKRLSCFNGAIRIYWPGFDPENRQQYHPLFLPERMREHAARGRPIEQHLFQRLSSLAIVGHVEGELARTVRDQAEARRRGELQQLRSELLERQGSTDEEVDRLELQLLELMDERDSLLELNRDLQAQLDSAMQNIQEISRDFGSVAEEAEDYAAAAEEEIEVQSVSHALELIAELQPTNVQVWETARESAEEADFARPEEVLDALRAVATLAEINREASATGNSTGPWRTFFEQEGLKYAATEGESTMNQYGDRRVFGHEGKRLRMEKHVTLGGGSRRDCVQIYFEFDEDSGKMLVGYCGRHLPYASQRT